MKCPRCKGTGWVALLTTRERCPACRFLTDALMPGAVAYINGKLVPVFNRWLTPDEQKIMGDEPYACIEVMACK